ncbi:MAG: ATP-binding protein [Actinomycetota bacterium]|nr:ATP-binding protein [Actinomycetota bacterium]
MADVELEIPSRSIYVGVVRLAISSLGRTAGLPEETVDDLKIAASEACANAVLGADEAGSDDRVVVGWTEHSDRVVVTVTDRSGDPGRSESLDAEGFSSRRGMSEALLQSLVDDVSVTEGSDGLSQVSLTVSRPPI